MFKLSAKEEERQNQIKMRNFNVKHSFMDPVLSWLTTNRISNRDINDIIDS